MSVWSVYLVRCRDGSLYTGIAVDVERRFAEHVRSDGRGAKYLRGRGPLELVATCSIGDRGLAQSIEHRIKRLSKPDKEMLVQEINSEEGSIMERIRRVLPPDRLEPAPPVARGPALPTRSAPESAGASIVDSAVANESSTLSSPKPSPRSSPKPSPDAVSDASAGGSAS